MVGDLRIRNIIEDVSLMMTKDSPCCCWGLHWQEQNKRLTYESGKTVEVIDKLLMIGLDIFIRQNFKLKHKKIFENGVIATWPKVASEGITKKQRQ